MVASLGRCSRQIPLGGVPEADPGHIGETLSLGWAGRNFEYSLKNWRKGRRKSGNLCLVC